MNQMTFKPFFSSYLKQKSISQGVAETEHKVLFGMFWNSLNNAALYPDGVLGNTVVVDSRTAIRLIEEQSATWGEKKRKIFLLDSSDTAAGTKLEEEEVTVLHRIILQETFFFS